jgi:hypothetical protein
MPHLNRRFALLIVIVCLTAAAVPVTGSAFGGPPLHVRLLSARELTKLARWRDPGWSRISFTPRDIHLPAARSRGNPVPHRNAGLTGSALRLPSSDFAPATIDPQVDRVEDNSLADLDFFGIKGTLGIHTRSYADLGRITGYYEFATWNASGGTVNFRYHGSIMADAHSAQTAQQDNVSHQLSAFSAQASPCQIDATHTIPDCNVVFFQGQAGSMPFDVQDVAWAVNSCLVETEAEYPSSLESDSATLNQIGTSLSAINNAGAQLASKACGDNGAGPTATATVPPTPGSNPTPTSTAVTRPRPTATATATRTRPRATATSTPTTVPASSAVPTLTPTSSRSTGEAIALLAVRVTKTELKSDLSRPSLSRVKAHQSALLSIFLQIGAGALAGRDIDYAFDVKRGSKDVVSKSLHEQVPDKRPAQSRETTTAQFTKKGQYTFTGTVTYLGQSEHQSTTFAVVAAAKKVCTIIAGHQYCTQP